MPGPLLSGSLSDYSSPDYDLDTFPTYRDGKTVSSRLQASAFNQIASSIFTTQTRAAAFGLTFSVDYDVTKNLYFDTVGVTGTCASSASLTNTEIDSEYFIGGKSYNSTQAYAVSHGSLDKFDPNSGSGPLGLGTKLGEESRDLHIVASGALKATPLSARGQWNGTPNYVNEGAMSRVIIGSGRAQRMGYQYRINREVYRLENNWPPDPSLSGTPTNLNYRFPVPTGYVGTGKDLLGPGALFVTGTFWIPHDSSWGINNNSGRYKNRFAWLPGVNAGPSYAFLPEGDYWAHVIVFGRKA